MILIPKRDILRVMDIRNCLQLKIMALHVKKLSGIIFFLIVVTIYGQQNTAEPRKYALVMGNGDYTGIARLNNPVNDAGDMAAALTDMGFSVDRVINGNLEQMERAIMQFKNRLSVSRDTYGFFFYAGHGVQSSGENYLIPVDANIQSEGNLRVRAVSVGAMLDDLNSAGNELNIVILDACRDNPFGWSRGGNRGLSILSNAPADSIIVYATSAGSTASDGQGRNGLFTEHLLKNLRTPGLEANEVFRLTMGDVARASGNQQRPAIYNQFPGTAYLGSKPAPPSVFEPGFINVATGSLEITTVAAGTMEIIGGVINQKVEMPEWGSLPIARINAGSYKITMRYTDGKVEERSVAIGRSEAMKIEFDYKPGVQAAPVRALAASPPPSVDAWTSPFLSPYAGWYLVYADSGSSGSISVTKEILVDQMKEVLNIETSISTISGVSKSVIFRASGIGNFGGQLRAGSGVRFKVLGDGKPWIIRFPTLDTNTPNNKFGHFRSSFSTSRNTVKEITIQFSRLRQGNSSSNLRFNKDKITSIEFHMDDTRTATSNIKIFDFEVIY